MNEQETARKKCWRVSNAKLDNVHRVLRPVAYPLLVVRSSRYGYGTLLTMK